MECFMPGCRPFTDAEVLWLSPAAWAAKKGVLV